MSVVIDLVGNADDVLGVGNKVISDLLFVSGLLNFLLGVVVDLECNIIDVSGVQVGGQGGLKVLDGLGSLRLSVNENIVGCFQIG